MNDFWRGKKVLVTGHTGFKGSWLCLWLQSLGAHVSGIALAPDGPGTLFNRLELADSMDHTVLDIRERVALAQAVAQADPDIVFHLAAQSLVIESYAAPIETWQTNLSGTLNLLGALQELGRPVTAVIVTTDKVYENTGAQRAHLETDHLGGHDPYSASKAAAELLSHSWRQSFGAPGGLRLATARAGNVIGGGDRAANRLIPDLVCGIETNQSLMIRSPNAVRPWQHVLEPLAGYMRLAEALSGDMAFAKAYNFGPSEADFRSVRALIDFAHTLWQGHWSDVSDQDTPHESGFLTLNSDLARRELGWTPKWRFETAVTRTLEWYKAVHEGADVTALSHAQITEYQDYAV